MGASSLKKHWVSGLVDLASKNLCSVLHVASNARRARPTSQLNKLHCLICVARCASVWGPGLSCLKAASNESRDPKRKHGHKELRPSMALHHCKSHSVSLSILAVRVYLQPDELYLERLEDLEVS